MLNNIFALRRVLVKLSAGWCRGGYPLVATIARLGWRIICWIELTVFTLLLYLLSFLPRALLDGFYFRLFQSWSRTFVQALGVDLRVHQKNRHPLPAQYILIANHPSAFEDIGIPAVFPVHSLAKVEVADWWLVGRISTASGSLYVRRESKESRAAAGEPSRRNLARAGILRSIPRGAARGGGYSSRFAMAHSIFPCARVSPYYRYSCTTNPRMTLNGVHRKRCCTRSGT